MKGGSPATTKQETKVQLPKWVEKAGKGNYKFAEEIAGRKMPIYKGQEVADMSSMTTDAMKYQMEQVGAQDPLFANAAALQGRVTELDPIYGKAQGILSNVADSPWDPTGYLNPYTEEVEKRSIGNAERSLDRSLMAQSDKARKAGAFGGSASGVERGVLTAEGIRGIGDLSAELRRAGYDKATSDMLADRAMKKGTAESMMAGASTQNQGWLDSARGFLDTASGRGKQVMADIAGMLTMGGIEEGHQQKLLDEKKDRFYEKKNRALERLNIRLSALGMTPYGKTETVEGESTPATQGPDWATAALGFAQLIPGLSDRRDKKDIQELGTDETTGLPVYAFRYKDAPANSPKVVGPMAQDVEKKYPHMVREIGGHKIVDGRIMGLLAA